jgi:uncharacterized membrane protein
MTKDRFSRMVFMVAGIYGILVLAPGLFGEKMLAEKMPPAITHPEFYYGFFGVALAWQVVFLIIAGDPVRFRPIIPAAILEKLTFCVACAVLLALGRIPLIVALGGAGDFILGTLFTIAYFRLKPQQAEEARFADTH